MIYLVILTAIFCAVYLSLLFVLPAFFKNGAPQLTMRSLLPCIWIIGVSVLMYIVSITMADEALGNRLLHMFGGGFLAFAACFFATRNSNVNIAKFQFFLLSMLVVTTLGVGNELLEFLLQSTTGVIFAPTINDTWLDLLSNTIGALLASAIFVPLLRPRQEPR